jgi:hypothetical protein
MASRNCSTSLKRRARSDTMLAYDLLPPDLRRWLAEAVLPWSAASVRRAWRKAMTSAQGDRQAARAALNSLERRRLEKDVARIWGASHPFLIAHHKAPAPEND